VCMRLLTEHCPMIIYHLLQGYYSDWLVPLLLALFTTHVGGCYSYNCY
jgi:hypothetical protein